ncbi:hypothetical protein [Psychrobacter sp. H8-1]|nr:hypothetical protein [Psychrobacter sp. H8-1]
MTYSADFRAQVIKSVKNKDMTIREACVLSMTLARRHYNAG